MAMFIGGAPSPTIAANGTIRHRIGYKASRADPCGEIAVKTSDQVHVTLDRSVALVLFEFLSRTTDEEDGEPLAEALQFNAELHALWATLASLEEVLTEPFVADYHARVKPARADVVKKFGTAQK